MGNSTVGCNHSKTIRSSLKPAQYNNPSEGHLAVLDALRGACAFWVLLGHTAGACGAGEFIIIRSHAVAVDIFMFISGFLMTYHYRLREDREPWSAPSTWLKFYTRRFFRLAPVYYLLLLVTLIFRNELYDCFVKMSVTFPQPWFHFLDLSATPPPWSWASVIAHFTFLFGFIPKYCSDGHLPDWSIGLEMQFYLAFPFLMLLFRRFGYWSIAIACLVIWGISHELFGVYITGPAKLLGNFPQPSFLPLKLDCFLFGILVAEAYWFRHLRNNLSMALLLFVAGMTLATHPTPYLQGAILLCICLIFLNESQAPSPSRIKSMADRFLNSRLVHFMADTSYSVYLIHFPILLFVTSWFCAHPGYVSLSPMVRLGILWGLMVGITYPLAFISFKLIEQPGIKAGQHVVKTFGRNKKFTKLP